MLGAPALKFSAWKKRAFWTVAQRPALRWASLMHATSCEEARAIEQAGIKAPVTVVPNGVTMPQTSWANTASRRTILSLGRIHPKKGLGRLVEAWSVIEGRFPDWHVRIIGPDERDHSAELIAQIGRLGVSRITVEGPLFGEEKEAVYREAGVFVLPTQNENFGLTVAEALAAETPVISSKGAPWSGLETHGCGRWVEHGTEPLTAALVDLLEMDDLQRSEMGLRGREWMKAEFSWDSIGTSLLAAYRLALTSKRMRQLGINGATAHGI
jgi:glycosyltransferase involved in cell wall biosynthesis